MPIDPSKLEIIEVSTLPSPPDPTRIKIPVVDLVSDEVYLLDGSYYMPKVGKDSLPIVDKSPMKESDSTVPSTRLVKEYVGEVIDPVVSRVEQLEAIASNPHVHALSVSNVRVTHGIPFTGKTVSIFIAKEGKSSTKTKVLFSLGEDFSVVRSPRNSGVAVMQNGEQVGDKIPFKSSGLLTFSFNEENTEVKFWVNDVAVNSPITLGEPVTSRSFTIDSKDEEICFIKVSSKIFTQGDVDEVYSQGILGSSDESKELFGTYIHAFLNIGLYRSGWVNMGTSNIPLIYVEPIFNIKDYRPKVTFGNEDPSSPPYMLGQEYYNVNSGIVWKCLGKPNTRQFEISDWKEIKTQITPE